MKYLLILIVAVASLGLAGVQGADKQNNKSCCDGGKCCAKQQACCQKSHNNQLSNVSIRLTQSINS